MSDQNYYIRVVDENTLEARYYSYDSQSGYTIMDGWNIQRAVAYTLDKATAICKSLLKEDSIVLSDGSEYPPDFISRGLEMNYAKPKARGRLEIVQVIPAVVSSFNVSGEIKNT